MDVKTVAVIGSGTMGRGIAQVSAMAGFTTWVVDLEEEILQSAMEGIATNLSKGVELGKVPAEVAETTRQNLQSTTDFDEAVSSCQLVIEAVPEKLELKLQLFERAENAAPSGTVLATNTSSLSITEIASGVQNASRVIGMHFFNPVHIMKLVEIVRGLETSESTFQLTKQVATVMGKETVDINESPGFVTSRINALIGNEAFYMLQEGVTSPEDIDKALKLGLNHPMGPFEMIDLVGLDVRLGVLDFLHQRLGEKYRPCPLLIQYVNAGRLGRKAGKGVYDYGDDRKK